MAIFAGLRCFSKPPKVAPLQLLEDLVKALLPGSDLLEEVIDERQRTVKDYLSSLEASGFGRVLPFLFVW